MRAAILGAGGLVGSAVMAELRSRGHLGIGIGRGRVERQVDLADSGAIQPALFEGCQAMVHCAGVTDEEVTADLGAASRRAMDGTQRLIEAARNAGIKRFVYISSAHVYGPLNGEIDEAHPADPRSNYALLHFAAEQIMRRMLREEAEAGLILRPCAVFGPLPDAARFRRWSLVPFSFPRDAATTGEIRLASSGSQRRNFVSSVAIGEAVVDWLERGSAGLSVINAIGVDDLSVFELAQLSADICTRVTGRACRVTRPEAAAADAPPLRYRSRTERPRTGLTLTDHLESIIKAYGDMGAHQ